MTVQVQELRLSILSAEIGGGLTDARFVTSSPSIGRCHGWSLNVYCIQITEREAPP
jgi:hypothetical protein